MPVFHALLAALLCLPLVALPGPVSRFHHPVWIRGEEHLAADARPCVIAGLVVAWGDDGTSTLLKAFRQTDGSTAWTSPGLDRAINESWSAPAADLATSSVLLATGQSVHCLDAETGAMRWTAPLARPFTNSSPEIAGDRVFVSSFGGFVPSIRRVYALNLGTGAVEWERAIPGSGHETPLLAGSLVIVLTTRGMAALDAASGETQWDSEAPLAGEPWETTHRFFGGLATDGAHTYACTYDFFGAGEVVAVENATGRLAWSRAEVLSTDATPLLIGGRVVLPGHRGIEQEGRLLALDAATGGVLWDRVLSPTATVWNLSAVALGSLALVTEGAASAPFAACGAHLIDPATGDDTADLAGEWQLSGTPAVCDDGAVFALVRGGRLACFRAPTIHGAFLREGTSITAPAVTLELDARDAESVRVSVDGNFGPWRDAATEIPLLLYAQPGTIAVGVQASNGSGESSVFEFEVEANWPETDEGWHLR